MMSNILIEANNISKVYGHKEKVHTVLNRVDFRLYEGDFICIMGTSGSGKSTLLNCLSTLDTLSDGSIQYKGKNIESMSLEDKSQFRYENIGFVFQNHNLISYLSIYDNIVVSALLAKTKSLKTKVLEIAKELDIEQLLDKFPYECSGGECQRIAIARALINDPKIIFCDEPTGNLDSRNSQRMIEKLTDLHKKGKTIVLVTHDPFIASYCQTFMYLEDGYIKTKLQRNDKTREEFYQEINHIVSKDSILESIKNGVIEETKEEIKIEKVVVEDKKKEFLTRQRVYMILKDNQVSQEIKDKYTLCYLQDNQFSYRNQYNEEIKVEYQNIDKICMNIKVPQVHIFSMYSSPIFYIDMDILTKEGTYQFEVTNRDDLIEVIHWFMKLHISIEDHQGIIDVYKQYPRDYERQKYYYRTYILKKKRG